MTDHRAHHHDDQTVNRWLTQHQHALTRALDDVLDIEAGLREILVHSRQDTAADDLDTVLDTEAGLAAILPSTPEPAAPPSTHRAPHDRTGAQELLRALSPADRMTLRNTPEVRKASRDLARDHTRLLDRSLAPDIGFALARDLARDLNHALYRDLNRALDRSRDLAHGLDLDFALDLARARAVSRDLHHALDRNLDLDLVLNLALDHAHDLNRALDRSRDLALDRDPLALDRDLHRTLNLAGERALALARILDGVRALYNARILDGTARTPARFHLTRAIVDVRTAEVHRAIALALRREPSMLDGDSLHTLLNDFTTADLSDVDLTDMDLSGVHWSERGTQWPPVIDVEDLKTRSDETPPGSGTWIVRSGTATIRDLAEL